MLLNALELLRNNAKLCLQMQSNEVNFNESYILAGYRSFETKEFQAHLNRLQKQKLGGQILFFGSRIDFIIASKKYRPQGIHQKPSINTILRIEVLSKKLQTRYDNIKYLILYRP